MKLYIKMAYKQHLISRCVLFFQSDPSTLGTGVPTKTRLESNTKKYKPPFDL